MGDMPQQSIAHVQSRGADDDESESPAEARYASKCEGNHQRRGRQQPMWPLIPQRVTMLMLLSAQAAPLKVAPMTAAGQQRRFVLSAAPADVAAISGSAWCRIADATAPCLAAESGKWAQLLLICVESAIVEYHLHVTKAAGLASISQNQSISASARR